MTAKRSDKERLTDILESIENIRDFSMDLTLDQFLKDKKTQSSVLLQFLIIGEAISQFDPFILEKFDYPWFVVKSFRNFIAHEYFNIKMERIWFTIADQLPELEAIIKLILNKEFGYYGN